MQENICTDGYHMFAAAVVEKAVKDYENALKRVYRKPNDIGANKIINDCERFFNDEIAIYSDLDGSAIMRVVRERVRREG